MKPIFFFRVVAICAALASLGTIPMNAAPSQTSRQVLDADSGWRFLLGDPSSAEARQFADGSWRTVNLPHDWSIEGMPPEVASTLEGRAGIARRFPRRKSGRESV
jgi:beta-galactosidase